MRERGRALVEQSLYRPMDERLCGLVTIDSMSEPPELCSLFGLREDDEMLSIRQGFINCFRMCISLGMRIQIDYLLVDL